MGRLIDADKLIDYFYYGQDDKPIIDGIADRKIIEIIKEQPTAYDIEKVVAELEELKDVDVCEFAECVTSECADCVQKNLPNKAIEIVRKGGVE